MRDEIWWKLDSAGIKFGLQPCRSLISLLIYSKYASLLLVIDYDVVRVWDSTSCLQFMNYAEGYLRYNLC